MSSLPERDFSQSGEQDAIMRWARRREPGRFLDIGAGEGEKFSNTRALALAGWKGVAVEPASSLFDNLARLYAGRDERGKLYGQVQCVNAAVVPNGDAGLIRFHHSRRDFLSSTIEAHRERWPQVSFEQVWVSSVPLDRLLATFGTFHMVNIDTEGTSIDLLKAFSKHEAWASVGCVCVEIDGTSERLAAERVFKGWRGRLLTSNNMVRWRNV